LEDIYNWLWIHLMKCHKDEFKGGVLFKIVSEYKKMSKEKITRNQKFKEDLKNELKVGEK